MSTKDKQGFEWPVFHSRHTGRVEAASQDLVDEIDDLMDLVVAENAAREAGSMVGRFVARNPNAELGDKVIASSKECFASAIDRGAEMERKRKKGKKSEVEA